MYRPPYAHQQPQGEQRNFGSDLNAMLQGMSRIVQLLFTGIPVLTFLGTVTRYLWKFMGFLGQSAARALPTLQQRKLLGEEVWADSGVSWNRVKVAALVAVAALTLRILLRKRQIQAEDMWDESSSSSEGECEVAEDQPLPYGLKSEEDRVAQQAPQYEDSQAYPDDFWDQYS